jgi:23S rRNA (guanosine2251-2'-O)-methyltransferase
MALDLSESVCYCAPMSKNNKRRDPGKKITTPFTGKRQDGTPPSKPQTPVKKTSSDRPKGAPWLYGRHAVIAALENQARHCHRLVVTKEFMTTHGDELQKALDTSERKRPGPEISERSIIDDLLGSPNSNTVHQGIALQADPLPRITLEDILPELDHNNTALVVILDQATDPQNIGAVLRSAAAFGAQAVLIPERNAPETTASLAKAACGALERIPFVRITNLSRSLEQLKEVGFWSVGLDGYAETLLSKIDMTGKTVLVMGSEGSGMRRLTREKCDFLAKIPISQTVESLNLSNATAVSLYEIARQRASE